MALLLVQEGQEIKSAMPWLFCKSQLLGGGLVTSSSQQFKKGAVIGDCNELMKWIELVANAQFSEVAIHRLNSMFSRQRYDIDAIIDGIIVWENLFGAGGTHELRYRISMNMARVIADTTNDRLRLQKEIVTLYDKRSHIVHGGKPPNSSEVSVLTKRIGEITIAAIRSLLTKYPSLVNSGDAGFKRLFLEGAEEPDSSD